MNCWKQISIYPLKSLPAHVIVRSTLEQAIPWHEKSEPQVCTTIRNFEAEEFDIFIHVIEYVVT